MQRVYIRDRPFKDLNSETAGAQISITGVAGAWFLSLRSLLFLHCLTLKSVNKLLLSYQGWNLLFFARRETQNTGVSVLGVL